MITLVEALNYRCLRYASRRLDSFQVLVGPNASGKTTFMDVVGFLGDLANDGLETALTERSPTPEQLLFRGQGESFELAVEAKIPPRLRNLTKNPHLDTMRYEVSIGLDETGRQFELKAERLLFKLEVILPEGLLERFPSASPPPDSLLSQLRKQNNKAIINKIPGGNDNFYSETKPSKSRWAPSFKLGPQRSALRNLVDDEQAFPVATWFRNYLTGGIQKVALNSLVMRRPSPPTRISGFLPDGSNLPWVVARLREEQPERYQEWIKHLRTALPNLTGISTVERPEDKHCYMVYEYADGLKIHSWLVSDGTLRLTALTLPAYLADLQGMYLIEEPENGIHPKAISTAFDSLSSVYDAQVLLATHSPVVLNLADLDQVLCFAKDDSGATDIVVGSEHPALRKWQGEVDLGTLLASGVLE